MILAVLIVLGVAVCNGEKDDFKPSPLQPGPWVHKTQGEIWPRPTNQEKTSKFLIVDPNKLKIKVPFIYR